MLKLNLVSCFWAFAATFWLPAKPTTQRGGQICICRPPQVSTYLFWIHLFFISSTQMSEYPSSPCIHLKICSFHAGALRGGVTVTTVNLGTMDFFTQFTFQVSAGGFCLLWQTQITETVERDTLKLENKFEYIDCCVTVWTTGWFGFILQRFCTSWQTWRCGVYQRSHFERRQDKVRLLLKAFQRRVCKWLVWKLMSVEYTSRCDGVRKANLRW